MARKEQYDINELTITGKILASDGVAILDPSQKTTLATTASAADIVTYLKSLGLAE